jgi:hypothetical protein
MITKLCIQQYRQESTALDERIAKATKEVGREPDEIHFSSSQTTASGGQYGHFAALLVWRGMGEKAP